MTICYVLGNSLYINITNDCTNACKFCVRTQECGIDENVNLWIDRDPTTDEIIEDIKKFNPDNYDEVVYCGYGEPLMKIDEFLQSAKFIKENYNSKIRVNTNGHASICAGRNVVPEFKGLVDAISISLNEKDAGLYNELCVCQFGEKGFDAMIDFTKECIGIIPEVTMSVVDVIPKEHIEECRKIAEEIGAKFRVREMIE